MPSRFPQGTNARTEARFVSGAGALVDPVNPLVDIIDVTGVEVTSNIVPVRESLGVYYALYALPVNAALGYWRGHWTASMNGAAVEGDDVFEVVLAGTVVVGSFVPWVTLEEAQAETGETFTETQLSAAADDVYMAMRWIPDPLTDLGGGAMREVLQRRALGRAIAWQAAYRKLARPGVEVGALITSESLADYSVTYDTSRPNTIDGISTRARSLLAATGLIRMAGHSTASGGFISELDED